MVPVCFLNYQITALVGEKRGGASQKLTPINLFQAVYHSDTPN
jgi:hypothetical protein